MLITISDPTTSKEQDKIAFSTWSSQALDELGRVDFSSLDPLDSGIITGRVLAILKLSELLAPEYQQSWQYVLNEVKKGMPPDPGTPHLFKWMQGVEW
jgi:hypothetical protein